jgi:AraC-like DNA-binding protein
MLIHVMRAWLRLQDDDATDGWLLALRDPVVAGAMNAIHQRPAEQWTIESLAREVSVSRATLARRFAHLVGETPPDYLTRWRMDVAAQRLRDTDDTVGAIAAAVGYRSEYSFSRAFTRHRGIAPGRYRRRTRARALAAPDSDQSPAQSTPAREPAYSMSGRMTDSERTGEIGGADQRGPQPRPGGRGGSVDADTPPVS